MGTQTLTTPKRLNPPFFSPFSDDLKGTLPQNIFIIKSGHIDHINFLKIGGLNKLFLKFGANQNLSNLLVH